VWQDALYVPKFTCIPVRLNLTDPQSRCPSTF
jgi:hypothetical protein